MTILTPDPQPKPRNPGRPFFKVRCESCGAISWWGRFAPWKCKTCGSRDGKIGNLLSEELKRKKE